MASPDSIVDEIMEECDDEWSVAEAMLAERITGDEALTEWAITYAAHNAVRESSYRRRRKIRHAKRAENLKRMGSWYDYPLQNGLHLGDAKKADLERELAWHRILAQANAQKVRWYAKLLKALPDGDTSLRDAIGEEQIGALHDEYVTFEEAA